MKTILTAAPPLFPPLLHLSLALATLPVLMTLLLFEARTRPSHPRLLLSGDAAAHSSTADATPPSRRARCLHLFLQAALAILLTAATLHAAFLAVRLFFAPRGAGLAAGPTYLFLQAVLRRTLAVVDPSAPPLRLTLGVPPNPLPRRWATLHLTLALVALAGVSVSVLPRPPHPRPVGVLLLTQAALCLIVALPAALVLPSALPRTQPPLARFWADRVYVDNPEWLNETRLLANWFVPRLDDHVSLARMPNVTKTFCLIFNRYLPPTPARLPDLPPSTVSPTTVIATTTAAIPAATTSTTVTTTTTTTASTPITTTAVVDTQPATIPPPSTSGSSTSPPSTSSPVGVRPTAPNASMLRQSMDSSGLNDSRSGSPGSGPGSSSSLSHEPRLPQPLVGALFQTYVVGKPVAVGPFRVLLYLGLPVMAAAPMAVGQLCRAWALYPFVGLWGAAWLLFAVLGAPGALSVLAMPREAAQVVGLCGRRYRVLVADGRTLLVARLDATLFAVILVVALVQGYRWLRLAERGDENREESEVKVINYEEVYSDNGSLRW